MWFQISISAILYKQPHNLHLFMPITYNKCHQQPASKPDIGLGQFMEIGYPPMLFQMELSGSEDNRNEETILEGNTGRSLSPSTRRSDLRLLRPFVDPDTGSPLVQRQQSHMSGRRIRPSPIQGNLIYLIVISDLNSVRRNLIHLLQPIGQSSRTWPRQEE